MCDVFTSVPLVGKLTFEHITLVRITRKNKGESPQEMITNDEISGKSPLFGFAERMF